MELYDSPFRKLLHNQNALQFWNSLVDKPEEEQTKVMAKLLTEHKKIDHPYEKKKPFGRISPKIKRIIKTKKHLSLEHVKELEDDMVEFFKVKAHQMYVKTADTYLERMLLHGIAQYHGLHTLGVVGNGTKLVEVYNINQNWTPAECLLVDFMAQIRK